jgi:hypothetical protein
MRKTFVSVVQWTDDRPQGDVVETFDTLEQAYAYRAELIRLNPGVDITVEVEIAES